MTWVVTPALNTRLRPWMSARRRRGMDHDLYPWSNLFDRKPLAWPSGAPVAVGFGLLMILWFEHGVLWEWDYWMGEFGLVVMAFVEVILFMWVFKPENAWRSLHQGADMRIPGIFKFVMTYITPLYLGVILISWAYQQAIPILTLQTSAGGGPVAPGTEVYVHASRLIIVGFIVGLIARAVKPGNDSMGIIMTTLLGIAGAFIAGFLGQALGWYSAGEPAGWIASVIGAPCASIDMRFRRPNQPASS